jgi:CelD/BcsL family acetyltransferase involved in cellulose biosynthesis
MLTVERIVDNQSWLELQGEWDELVLESSDATAFQTFPWLFSWWEVFGEGELLILVARDERQRLVGLAPLSVQRNGFFWSVKFLAEGISDYLNFILHPRRAQECVDLFIQFLKMNYSRFALQLLDIPPFALIRNLDVRLKGVSRSGHPCPTVALPSTWDEYKASLSKKHRQSVAIIRNRLGDEVTIEPVEEGEFPEALSHLFRLHEKLWRSRGESGVLAQTGVQEFHARFVRQAAGTGIIRMYSIEVSGKIIGIEYGFKLGPRMYFYISGMDPEFQNHSPGSALMGRAIQGAIEEGVTHADLLRGAEPYKAKWGAETGKPNTHFVYFSDISARMLFTVAYLARKVAARFRR